MNDPAIIAEDLVFAWPGHAPVLDISRLDLARGETLFLRGPSGSGKSTLLGLIAGVLKAGSGRLDVLGHDMNSLSGAARDRLRADHLGVIFQIFNLVPYLSVTGNVTLPLLFSPERKKRVGADAAAEARRLLARLGLEGEDLLSRRVSDLSVGQQQRVAAARALIGAPDIVIADEPTSAMDSDTRDRFIRLLKEEAGAAGSALLFVSHDLSLASHFDRAVSLGDINRAKVAA